MEKKVKKDNVWIPFFQMLKKAKLPWIWVIITFALSLGGSALQLMFPDYTEQVIGGDVSRGTVTIFVLVMIATAVVNILTYSLQGVADAKINRSMRKSVWRVLTGLPVEKLEEQGAKELISRNTTDTNAVSNIFSSTLPGIASTLYYVIGSVVSVGQYAVSMSVTMVGLVAAHLILSFFAGKVVYRLNHKTQTKLAYLTESVAEVMSNLPLVKIFTAEKRESERGRKMIQDYNRMSFTAQTVSNLFYYMASLINLIGALVVIVYGGVMVKRGVIDIGQWVAYFMYYRYLGYDVQMVPYYWKELKGLQGTVRRLSSIAVMQEEDVTTGKQIEEKKQDLKFENVSFAYGNHKVLDNVSFSIPHGSYTVFVGENGAGKTTLVNLLERFYVPGKGKISYGSSDAAEISLESWRQQFSYVQQDMRLMGGTIRENLLYGVEKTVTEEELKDVCQKVHLEEFIGSQPNGMDTKIEDFGDNLSGGQCQKIAIARAILRDAEYLILDEYTSSLDPESERQIRECVEKLRGEKTILVIAHKMEMAKDADQIIVLADHKVEASGTHEQLMEASAVYQKLWKAQMD